MTKISVDREIALQKRVAELEKERMRLCGEVTNRNMRALEGDKAQAAFDQLYAEHEALLAQVETSRKQEAVAGMYGGTKVSRGAPDASDILHGWKPLYAAPVVAPDVLKDAERYRFRRGLYIAKHNVTPEELDAATDAHIAVITAAMTGAA